MFLQIRRLAVLLPFVCAAIPALAQDSASGWVRQPEVALRLVAAATGAGSDASARLGLEIELKHGWKTYWRSPGDAGLPVEIDWAGSTNLADAKLRYPAPERFTLFDFETFGYGGTVVLPIDATKTKPGDALDLRAGVELLVCADVCIPYHADPPVDADGAGANGLTLEAADFRAGPPSAIVVRARAEPAFAVPDIYVEGPNGWSFAKPAARFAEGGRAATLTIPAAGGPGAAPLAAGEKVTLTLVDGMRAVERTLALGNAPPAAPPASLLAMLAVALLGGLILNLMPCVLPVLAMKLASVVKLDASQRRDVRAAFLATAAGIVAAFLLLAAALVALKLAGEAVGWGLQFQQPWFLAGMALVVVAFAANLWGWFEMPLPEILSDLGASRKLAGSFATGVFATLLATPCSAPFVGTAVGFALAQGPLHILAIFAALGLGLAAPYLAVASVPAAAGLLPRPGPWIAVLRRILGLALAGTAAWLVWVLAAQLGPLAAGVLALALVLLAAGLFGLRKSAGPRGRIALVMAVLMLALFLPPRLAVAPAASSDISAIPWQRFERTALDAAVAQGKTVFVDVTADWCVTCQVNKRLVVGRGEVGARLAAGGIVALRADWTRPDPRISAYLAEFGRYGIPFNAVYGPGAPGGLALPELLTADSVLAAFAAAAGR
ncbi:MAG: thioredoxin family protein [Proteobacteria bacterium]|nr:thioredoxin family protein [Pseudomonadota bacterium]